MFDFVFISYGFSVQNIRNLKIIRAVDTGELTKTYREWKNPFHKTHAICAEKLFLQMVFDSHIILLGLGSAQEAPISSCKKLKEKCKVCKNGQYWIDFGDDVIGLATCEMETDGGT